MDLEMVFNELSARNLAPDISIARQWMSELISTMLEAKRCGLKAIRIPADFHAMVLAENYPLASWRNDNQVNRDERTFLRTLATKTPLSVDISDLKIKIKVEDPNCELSLQGSQAEGFKVAHYLETLAISLNSELLWNSSRIKLELTQIDESGELIEEIVEVIHASQKNHVIEHDDWIQKRQLTGVIDGLELWNRRAELFSSLEFCDRLSEQIQSVVDPTMLRQIVRKLFELEALSKNWTDGALDLEKLPSKVSPESESRLKQFREQLNIKCLDGTKRMFSLHVRMTPGAWRLHFCTELGPGKIIIGYIGPKIQ
ncbi:MAG: hypothetical protein EAZ39_14185 [Oscillatoriales cyanobacterium]|uniref:hypothetical protein n=1 Tax=unclassified Microcoleus TaxID=2642155 RepID=UPI001DB8B470|nr:MULTISPECIES: hypothetical protein [unclassified Microcoleus]TAE67253.1 MAG: hypothetical protein EAZ86_17555 [Oscillatoriales cyanobacterium]MCC3434074.1 hypothetical protein [Microcoleus sp. PH2017_05_CCC_O_A]MCC3446922.1 hypothetical protein [Microcoleus sp. PH2017_09_SFU_O_A]MCC3583425.1 hypothetical protein [Microcoleus sp. PH2017_30_WIL_O_A]MCC3592769.1 hypothetical protein [Microcoleus sp. PH2017_28_MFU_U_A]